jgi:endonuclease G
MKNIILFICLLFPTLVYSQHVTIQKKSYTSYLDTIIKQPILVVYDLYNGGGDCKRDKFRFKNDTQYKTATDADYAKSGYDKGHLANAEDFAYDCVLDELTFRYYNCWPQTTSLNRGSWKQTETSIRELSKKDTIRVICYGSDFVKSNKLMIPTYCYKVVYQKGKFVVGYQFNQKGEVREVPKEFIESRLRSVVGFKLN